MSTCFSRAEALPAVAAVHLRHATQDLLLPEHLFEAIVTGAEPILVAAIGAVVRQGVVRDLHLKSLGERAPRGPKSLVAIAHEALREGGEVDEGARILGRPPNLPLKA